MACKVRTADENIAEAANLGNSDAFDHHQATQAEVVLGRGCGTGSTTIICRQPSGIEQAVVHFA